MQLNSLILFLMVFLLAFSPICNTQNYGYNDFNIGKTPKNQLVPIADRSNDFASILTTNTNLPIRSTANRSITSRLTNFMRNNVPFIGLDNTISRQQSINSYASTTATGFPSISSKVVKRPGVLLPNHITNNYGSNTGRLVMTGRGIPKSSTTYENELNGDYSAIRGIPGVDYPIYSQVPQTSFNCAQQPLPGYYADIEAQCQVFHICALNRTYSFLCPNGTIFSQNVLVCVWWYQYDCISAPSMYLNNAYIYNYGTDNGFTNVDYQRTTTKQVNRDQKNSLNPNSVLRNSIDTGIFGRRDINKIDSQNIAVGNVANGNPRFPTTLHNTGRIKPTQMTSSSGPIRSGDSISNIRSSGRNVQPKTHLTSDAAVRAGGLLPNNNNAVLGLGNTSNDGTNTFSNSADFMLINNRSYLPPENN